MNQICDTAVCMPDVQSSADTRQIAIDKVGIKSIRHPVRVADKSDGVQHTIANFNMYVYLPHNFKGTHMSRFIEHGDPVRMLADSGLDATGIEAAVRHRITLLPE
jgi:GTP cyclohydrolase I